MRRLVHTLFAVLAIAGLAALTTWGFIQGHAELVRDAEGEQPIKAPPRVSFENGETAIKLEAAAQQQSGLRTVELQKTQHHEQMRAYGSVLDVQPLLDLHNNYALAKAQVDATRAKLDASSAEFEREDKLFKTRMSVVTLDKLQTAEAAFHTDESALASAKAQLRTVEDTAKQSWGPVLGQPLGEENETLARLVQRRDYLVQVTLSPGVLIDGPPQTATIQLENGHRQEIHFISPATKANSSIQGVSLFYTLPASSELLPGMNVLALLLLASTVEGVIVPKDAVVWWQGRAWVYVRTSPSTFARRAIAADYPLPQGEYLDRALPGGAEVVVQGAQMLLSEEFRAQIQVGEGEEGK